jgi:hypothetical protein
LRCASDKDDLFTLFLVEQFDRMFYLQLCSGKQIVMTRIGYEKTVRRNIKGSKRLNDRLFQIAKAFASLCRNPFDFGS